MRSFVKRIDFEPRQVAISYTILMPIENDVSSEREVLSIGYNGEPLLSIDRTHGRVFKAVFAFE